MLVEVGPMLSNRVQVQSRCIAGGVPVHTHLPGGGGGRGQGKSPADRESLGPPPHGTMAPLVKTVPLALAPAISGHHAVTAGRYRQASSQNVSYLKEGMQGTHLR